jgi:hypothetical protein
MLNERKKKSDCLGISVFYSGKSANLAHENLIFIIKTLNKHEKSDFYRKGSCSYRTL